MDASVRESIPFDVIEAGNGPGIGSYLTFARDEILDSELFLRSLLPLIVRWKKCEHFLSLTNPDSPFVIEQKRFSRRPPGMREPDNAIAVPSKVVCPLVPTGVEQQDHFGPVNCRHFYAI